MITLGNRFSGLFRAKPLHSGALAQIRTAKTTAKTLEPMLNPVHVDPTSAGVRRLKPTSPALRAALLANREGIWKGGPVKNLSFGTTRQSGRNSQGRITVRHWGGAKQRKKIRIVDFTRSGRLNVPATVIRLEYDPNRSAYLALLQFNGPALPETATKVPGVAKARDCVHNDLSYILCPQGVRPGDVLTASRDTALPLDPGNAMPIMFMPPGTVVHNIEMSPGQGGKMCRSAGTSAMVLNKDETTGRALVRLSSGEMRSVLLKCMATVGRVGNIEHHNVAFGGAGRARRVGVRPTVRGVAMNAVDHPQGGKGVGGDRNTDPRGKYVKGQRSVRGKRVKNKGLRREIVRGRRGEKK